MGAVDNTSLSFIREGENIMPIIYAERTTVKKDKGRVVETHYYRDEKRVSMKEFFKFLQAARQEKGENLFEIYEEGPWQG